MHLVVVFLFMSFCAMRALHNSSMRGWVDCYVRLFDFFYIGGVELFFCLVSLFTLIGGV